MDNLKQVEVSLKLNFREVANQFLYIDFNDDIMTIVDKMELTPGHLDTGILGYCYIDYMGGLTVEGLAFAHIGSGSEKDCIKVNDVFGNMRIRIRMGGLEGTSIYVLEGFPNTNADAEKFSEIINELLKSFSATDNVIVTRDCRELDVVRNAYYPDDLAITLVGENKGKETVWVRCVAKRKELFLGTLLNEPVEDYGAHEGDLIPFSHVKINSGETVWFSLPEETPDYPLEDIVPERIEEDLHEMLYAFQHKVLPEVFFNCDEDEEDRETRLMGDYELRYLLENFMEYSYMSVHGVFPEGIRLMDYRTELYSTETEEGEEILVNILHMPLEESEFYSALCLRFYVVCDAEMKNPGLYTVEYDNLQNCYFLCGYLQTEDEFEHVNYIRFADKEEPDKIFELNFICDNYVEGLHE